MSQDQKIEALAELLFVTLWTEQRAIDKERGDRVYEIEKWNVWKDSDDGRTFRAMARTVLEVLAYEELTSRYDQVIQTLEDIKILCKTEKSPGEWTDLERDICNRVHQVIKEIT